MNRHHEGTLRRLRISEGNPVWGVRLQVRCGCGLSYPQTFVVGVERPYTHCPRCGNRTRLYLDWALTHPVREGQRVQITLSGG